MKFNVPSIKQPKDSVDCGIAGIAMIMHHHGKTATFDEIKRQVDTDDKGTYAPQLGTYLVRNGFDVTIITAHPKMFMIKDAGMEQDKILQRITYLISMTENDQDKKVLNYFKEFLDSGGMMRVKIPDEEDIMAEMAEHRPLGALLTTNFMNGTVPKFNFHFNIITGIDDRYIYANDPMWDERGGEKKYPKKDFFYGLYASAYGDLDNASLIIVKPKSL